MLRVRQPGRIIIVFPQRGFVVHTPADAYFQLGNAAIERMISQHLKRKRKRLIVFGDGK